MKTLFTLLFFVIVLAGCKTSKEGCPGASYQGPKQKTSKFEWYKG